MASNDGILGRVGFGSISRFMRVESDDNNLKNVWEADDPYAYTIGDVEKREAPDNANPNKTVMLWFQKEKGKNVGARKIFVSFKIKRISDIDNVKEQFRVRFHIYFNWLPTRREYDSYIDAKVSGTLFNWEPAWYPHMDFLNKIDTIYSGWEPYPDEGPFRMQKFKDFLTKVNDDPDFPFDVKDARFIRAKFDIEMVLSEELELGAFPFDCQDLSIIIRESSTKVKCVFLPELRKPYFGSIDPRYSVIDEWDLDGAMVEFGDTSVGNSRSGQSYPMFILRLKMKRRWQVFMWKVVLWMYCIEALALTAFSLEPRNGAGDRMSLGITLVLTAVAFLQVVWNTLPNVPYLTFLDKYVLLGYLFLTGIMVESSIMALPTTNIDHDRPFMFFSIVYLFVYNFIFLIYAIWLRQEELQKLFMNSDEIEAEVNLSRPALEFNYQHAERRGTGGRLLTFQAQIVDTLAIKKKRDQAKKEKEYERNRAPSAAPKV